MDLDFTDTVSKLSFSLSQSTSEDEDCDVTDIEVEVTVGEGGEAAAEHALNNCFKVSFRLVDPDPHSFYLLDPDLACSDPGGKNLKQQKNAS